MEKDLSTIKREIKKEFENEIRFTKFDTNTLRLHAKITGESGIKKVYWQLRATPDAFGYGNRLVLASSWYYPEN